MKKLTIALGLVAVLVATGVAYAAVSAVTDRPTAKVLPSISGAAREGDTLTAQEGTWERGDGLTYSYQWQRCDAAGANCAGIAAAASKAYVAQAADVGRKLRV